MIEMICKKIDAGEVDAGSCKRLLQYMTNPESERRAEKCVACIGENFSARGLTAERMAAEMMADASLSARVQEPVDHWVLSFKTDGENPPQEQIFKAVRQWIADMGYGERDAHKWTAAIHEDTEHIHCHIAICRVNLLTGKVKKRGLWKRDNQKALARMALEQGWKVGGETEFICEEKGGVEAELRTDSVTGEVNVVMRPHVKLAGDKAGVSDEGVFRKGHIAGFPARKQSQPDFKWPKPRNPPDEVDKVIALLKEGKYKNLPVTKEIGEELERRGIHVQRVPLETWQNNARRLDYRIQKQNIEDEALNYVNDKNVAEMKQMGAELWGKHRDWTKQKFKPGDKTGRAEYYTELKSDLRVLHERLKAVYAEMEPDLSKLKWGQIHKILMKYGIEMQRREHPNGRFGLVFSMDGQTWTAASKVFPPMSWGALNGRIGAKKDSWRDARDGVKEFLKTSRQQDATAGEVEEREVDQIIKTVLDEVRNELTVSEPMPEAEKKLTFNALSKSQVYALRDIDMSTARSALVKAGCRLRKNPPKVPKTAIDVAIHEAGLSYHDAAVKLAELFPEVARLGAEQEKDSYERILELAKQEILASGGKWRDFEKGSMGDRCGREIVRWWQALQLDHIDLHCATGHANRENKDRVFETSKGNIRHGIPTFIKDGCTLPELLAARPQLMAISAASDHLAPAHIFCTPYWRKGRVGIMLDDVREHFIKQYPPNALVHTSSESRQAFYIIDKKFESEFYDQFMRQLNEEFGDKKVLRVHHDTRVAGFFNKKRDVTLYDPQTGEKNELVKVEWSSTAAPQAFIGLMEECHAAWKSKKDEMDKADGETQKQQIGRPRTLGYETVKANTPEFEAFCESLTLVELPDWVENIGLETREALIERYAKNLDRSKVDSGTARSLYHAGANPDEIFSFFMQHLAQRELPGKDRIESDKTAERQARRLTANLAPAWLSPGGWRARKAQESRAVKDRSREVYRERDMEIAKIFETQKIQQASKLEEK